MYPESDDSEKSCLYNRLLGISYLMPSADTIATRLQSEALQKRQKSPVPITNHRELSQRSHELLFGVGGLTTKWAPLEKPCRAATPSRQPLPTSEFLLDFANKVEPISIQVTARSFVGRPKIGSIRRPTPNAADFSQLRITGSG